MTIFTTIATVALAAFSAPLASAHSWVEEMQVISGNGTFIGDRGYPRGYMARTDPGFNGFSDMWLLPQVGVRVNTSDPLCHPSQRTSNYTNPAYPKLKVAPGDYVAMKYLENGHVSLPWNQAGKPMAGGTVYVYGTTSPSDDEKVVDVLQWSADGKGGNGNGWLMTAQNFDDGRCFQVNCGNISVGRQMMFPNHMHDEPSGEQWCETDLRIPDHQPAGILTLYWLWSWPSAANKDCIFPDGRDEYYTTCSDIEVVAADDPSAPAAHTLVQENLQSMAVSNFRSRMAYTTSPAVVAMRGTTTSGMTATASSEFLSACSSSTANGILSTAPVKIPEKCDPVTIFSGAPVSSAFAAAAKFATTPAMTSAEATSTTASLSIPPIVQAPVTVTVTETTTASATETVTLAPGISTASPELATTSAAAFSTKSASASSTDANPANAISTIMTVGSSMLPFSAEQPATSSAPTSASSTASPSMSSTSPSESSTAPSESSTAPSESSTAPSETTTASSESSTAPSESTTASSSESSTPTSLPNVAASSESSISSSESSTPSSASSTAPSTASSTAPSSASSTPSTALSSSSTGLPYVGRDGMIGNVATTRNRAVALKHVVRHANRRHARQFER